MAPLWCAKGIHADRIVAALKDDLSWYAKIPVLTAIAITPTPNPTLAKMLLQLIQGDPIVRTPPPVFLQLIGTLDGGTIHSGSTLPWINDTKVNLLTHTVYPAKSGLCYATEDSYFTASVLHTLIAMAHTAMNFLHYVAAITESSMLSDVAYIDFPYNDICGLAIASWSEPTVLKMTPTETVLNVLDIMQQTPWQDDDHHVEEVLASWVNRTVTVPDKVSDEASCALVWISSEAVGVCSSTDVIEAILRGVIRSTSYENSGSIRVEVLLYITKQMKHYDTLVSSRGFMGMFPIEWTVVHLCNSIDSAPKGDMELHAVVIVRLLSAFARFHRHRRVVNALFGTLTGLMVAVQHHVGPVFFKSLRYLLTSTPCNRIDFCRNAQHLSDTEHEAWWRVLGTVNTPHQLDVPTATTFDPITNVTMPLNEALRWTEDGDGVRLETVLGMDNESDSIKCPFTRTELTVTDFYNLNRDAISATIIH